MKIKKTKVNKIRILVVLAVIVLLIGFIFVSKYLEYKKEKKIEDIKKEIETPVGELVETGDPLSTEGFLKIDDINIHDNAIILTRNCFGIIMTTTIQQTYSIQTGIEETVLYRPTTHDLIKNILNNFNIEILMIKIVDLREDTYFANLIIKQENKILNLDVKPSDAIAIAVRTDAPIYVKSTLLRYEADLCK